MSRVADAVGFVHLRVHSAYSLLEGALPLKRLETLARDDSMPALAMTDTGNLFGALEFSTKMSGAGIQPIVGCQISVDFASVVGGASDVGEGGSRTGGLRGNDKAHQRPLDSIVLLSASEEGYRNLVRLVSKSFIDVDPTARAHVSAADVATYANGLIALTGGPGGPVNRLILNGDLQSSRTCLDWFGETFGDRAYVELQRHHTPEESTAEPHLAAMAYDMGLPLVATNDAFFPTRADYEAHDALICISEGTVVGAQERRRLTPEHYFKTRAEMTALFADLPEATANTVEIAMRCAWWPRRINPILPRFAAEDGVAPEIADRQEAERLRADAEAGLERRLAAHGLAPGLTREDYDKRLDFELGIIERMKYPGYFLIVADFIKWAKAQGIPVGPGRGSGAGSVVAWSLTITDLDPLRYNLLFERFLNPDRVSMPDFDVDFCQSRRDEVIEHVRGKYGYDQVGQIITFGTLQARAVLRDVGRVLQMPYGQVDRLAKMVPQNPANPVTLSEAIADEPRLRAARDEEPIVGRLLDIAQKLEGLYRHASTHAAGVVIGDRPLQELVPLYRDPRSDMKVSQFNMKWVEQAGLVKFDFLGLRTLTVLDTAVRKVHEGGAELVLDQIPLDDHKTFEMVAKAETVGVFQLESGGMRRSVIDMKPDRFDDLIALVALYRPGPMANIPTYCHRKHGREEPDYIHPLLEPTLKETFGVIVYQEQVMKIAQVLAGYTLAEADLLRRAMGKKIRAEMEAQRERFVEGAVDNGVERAQAKKIFELLNKFAEYGFPKGHAAAYALVSYQTAYMKANHPVAFLAASMTLDAGNTEKLSEFRREAIRLDITVEPPSINRSGVEFDVIDGHIVYSLAAVRGVGIQAVEHIVEKRGDRPFADLGDFGRRIDPKVVNKRVLESLICAGAFDELEPDRARVMAGVERLVALATRTQDGAATGQNDLFGGSAGKDPLLLPVVDRWDEAEKLERERAAIGFYLSAHPLDAYDAVLAKMRVRSYAEFADAARAGAEAGRIAGTVTALQERRTRNGNRMAVVQLSDPSGAYEAVAFSETLNKCRPVLEVGTSLLLRVSAEDRPEGVSIIIETAERIEDAAANLAGIRVFLRDPAAVGHLQRHLRGGGRGKVSIVVLEEDGRREVELDLKGRFVTTPAIANALRSAPGVDHVDLV